MSSKTKITATKEEASPALVPKLRFPEFRGTEAWESKTLAEICLLITNGKANAQDHEEDGDYPLFDRSAVIKKSSDFMFDAEAVIIPGEGMRFVPKYFRGKFNLHQRAYALMRHHGDGRFVYHSLDYLQDALAGKAVKSTVLSLRLPIVENFVIGCPGLAEQQKIAEFLSSTDELIAAQARKVDELKTHKKGLMQQLFPREGETQPHLRFPEFQNAGEWRVKPMGELVELQSGHAFSSSNFGSEGGKLVTPKNFTKHGHGNFNESVSKYTTEEVPGRFVCKPGDLLVLLTDLTPTCELLGKPLLLEDRDGTVLLNQRVVRVEAPASELATLFLKYVFLSEPYNRRIIETATGSTVKHSSNKVLQEVPLVHPSLAEQQRIASCLSSLDALITAETQKHEVLKIHKKGLMQQLFPSPKEVEA